MQLYLFHHITQDPVIAALLHFYDHRDQESYFTAARGLLTRASHRICSGNFMREYLLRCMLEQEALPDIIHLRDFLRHDMKVLYQIFWETDWDAIFHESGLLSLSNPPVPVRDSGKPGYAFSLSAMIDCASNEALGGAILAHLESFEEESPQV